MTRSHDIRAVLWWVLALNVLVALAKLTYGFLTGALSMQADGFHSLFDGMSNVIGILGMWLAAAPPDDTHPYGHKKFETLAVAGIGGLLFTTCVFVLWGTYQSVKRGMTPEVTNVSFGVMLVTMAINAGVTRWELRKGKELKSDILIADSYHTASDFLTSLSVVLGLIAIRLGYPFVDPLIAIMIAGVIGWTAFKVLREVLFSLTDSVRLDPEEVRKIVKGVPGVEDCHQIRTRGLPHYIFVDLSIHVKPETSIEEAHEISHQVEELLKHQFSGVEDVVVHVEPDDH